MTLDEIKAALRQAARPGDAEFLQRFFKTAPGEYGAGDVFLGVRVPAVRQLARRGDGLARAEVLQLLRSRFHEERLLALVLLVRRFERGTEPERQEVVDLYLREIQWVNNWDLVDVSAPTILGGWLLTRPRGLLNRLGRSPSLWERRIAVLATFALIRAGQYADTLRLCGRLLNDREDLMHKACGWMLREIGKRDRATLLEFLEAHVAVMPRTTLRYAIEHLSPAERKRWLARPWSSRR